MDDCPGEAEQESCMLCLFRGYHSVRNVEGQHAVDWFVGTSEPIASDSASESRSEGSGRGRGYCKQNVGQGRQARGGRRGGQKRGRSGQILGILMLMGDG